MNHSNQTLESLKSRSSTAVVSAYLQNPQIQQHDLLCQGKLQNRQVQNQYKRLKPEFQQPASLRLQQVQSRSLTVSHRFNGQLSFGDQDQGVTTPPDPSPPLTTTETDLMGPKYELPRVSQDLMQAQRNTNQQTEEAHLQVSEVLNNQEKFNLVQVKNRTRKAVDSDDSDDIDRAAVDEEEDRLTEKNYSSSLQQSSDIHDTVEKNSKARPETALVNKRVRPSDQTNGTHDAESTITQRRQNLTKSYDNKYQSVPKKAQFQKKQLALGQQKASCSAVKTRHLNVNVQRVEQTPISDHEQMRTLLSENYQNEIKNIVGELDNDRFNAQSSLSDAQPLSQASVGRPKKKKTPNKSQKAREEQSPDKKIQGADSPKHMRKVSSDRCLSSVKKQAIAQNNYETNSSYFIKPKVVFYRSKSRAKSQKKDKKQFQESKGLGSQGCMSPYLQKTTESSHEVPDIYCGIRRQQDVAQKREIKMKLKQLFMNYCDFNYDSATPFISQTNFQKLIKDAKITGKNTSISQNDVSIMVATTLRLKINLVKTISLKQYLDCILAVAELKEPQLFGANPKAALKKVVSENFLPLLAKIEHQATVGLSKRSVSPGKNKKQVLVFSKVEAQQSQIIYNDDTLAIFTDILPLMRLLYTYYFDMEVNSTKGIINQSEKELKAYSLKSCLKFLKDFGVCPFMVSVRTCTTVWYTIHDKILTGKSRHQSVRDLCKNSDQKDIFQAYFDLGRVFSLEHFVIMFYRVAILAFDQTIHSDPGQIKDFNLIKKLLCFLHTMEKSDQLLSFVKKTGRTYSQKFSFLPSKDLLAQILVCEGLDKYMTGRTLEQTSKEILVRRILDGQHFVDVEFQTSRLRTIVQQQAIQEENDVGAILEQHEEKLRQLFQMYCSFGDPLNTKHLKSSKLKKMLQDCGLLEGVPRKRHQKGSQISLVEMDLFFKQVCATVSKQNTLSVLQDCTILDQNRPAKMRADLNFSQHKMSKPDFASISRKSIDSGLSGNQSQRTRKLSQTRSHINLLRSITPCRMSDKTLRTDFSASALTATRTKKFGERTQSQDIRNQTKDKFDFPCFIAFLIKLGPRIFRDLAATPKAAVLLTVEQFILPLQMQQNDTRSVQNSQVSKLVNLVNSKIMVDFMGELFCALSDIYPRYCDANSNQMTFDQFLSFCRDHDVFPYICSKPSIYRIFHALSMMNEALQPNKSFVSTRKQLSQFNISVMSPRGQQVTQSKFSERIDENLFVEALTLCAFYDESNQKLRKAIAAYDPLVHDEPSPQTLRACLICAISMVEKMNDSDGVYREQKSGKKPGSDIFCNMQDKKDLLAGFRNSKKYEFYFKAKAEQKKRFTPAKQKINFKQAMQMDSMLENHKTSSFM